MRLHMMLGKNSAFNMGGIEKIRWLYEQKQDKNEFPSLK